MPNGRLADSSRNDDVGCDDKLKRIGDRIEEVAMSERAGSISAKTAGNSFTLAVCTSPERKATVSADQRHCRSRQEEMKEQMWRDVGKGRAAWHPMTQRQRSRKWGT